MALYQSSVLKKFLKQLDQEAVSKAYKKFSKYFHNPTIQENIRSSKEEQFQATFLNELFVNIFGYSLNPNPNFNLTTEFKNEKNNRKADGAILKDAQAIGVIELKGTNTKDLESIRRQAFDYKANQKGCVYVITSNFEKLRFYINDATEFVEFDLFLLTNEQFELLYLCLYKDHILSNLPLQIKEASVVEEEQITKDFYKDYSIFKRELYRDLVKRNAKRLKTLFQTEFESQADLAEAQKDELVQLEKNVKLTLFKKSQKLIDRFLFIFFAEDRGLLQPNTTLQILENWQTVKNLDVDQPLYERFKGYFGYLDQGRKGTAGKAEIYAYNGGLFKPDAILDALEIDDELLYKHTHKLANYDFESQVDVNILGHIFENSLNEIESVNADIEGANFDKQKSKRKKDGVFYTPKYITKYIVENTVGKLCEEKKEELGFAEEEYFKSRKGRQKATLEKLIKILDDYREWLLGITICDPACGSGAFLNQALDFLIKEHRYIDELKAKLLGGGLVFSDIENTILENNIYGVDLNEESVEIAKLSLWLRTAQPRRKLNDLSSNIKCGNSLIDSKAVAGTKAFHWETQFPQVFAKGGFDVIIGNPPYVRQELVKEYSEYLKKFKVFSGKGDLYTYFYEKGYELLKQEGYLSYISSGKFFEAGYGLPLVKFLVEKFIFIEVINFDDLDVFSGISAYPLIYTGRKKNPKTDYIFNYCFVPEHKFETISEIVANLPFSEISILDFKNFNFNFYSKAVSKVFKTINANSFYLKDMDCLPLVGIKTGFNEGFTISENKSLTKPYIFGKNIKRYLSPVSDVNIIFPYKKDAIQYQLINESDLGECYEILNNNRNKLEKRAIIKEGIKNGTKKWYEYQQINRKLDFGNEYIVYPNVSLGANFTLSKGNVIDMTGFIIPSNDKFLLVLLNSKISEFVMKKTAITRRGGYQEFKVQYLSKIPLKSVGEIVKKEYLIKADLLIEMNNNKISIILKMIKYLISNFKLEKLSKKLESWHELTFGEFIKELNKAIKVNNKLRQKETEATGGQAGFVETPTLTKKDEFEWMELFEENKKKAQELQSQIDATEKEIDQMVYELYGLTEEEIAIVEGA
ncbi:Eco57I restriction-modification methylase domain-containing protein [Aquimarina sp. SS2-1]|uniref:Eco57I restriction-modification methylase domain-containing protein n=1 Tax=Aquimarina besae TaxID=3342247 RepID=UPI00366FB976